jgi:hypothetical protein
VERRRLAADDITAFMSLGCSSHLFLFATRGKPKWCCRIMWISIASRVARHAEKVVVANPHSPFPPVTIRGYRLPATTWDKLARFAIQSCALFRLSFT